jgi:tRNA uridine 5-carbamoylmethylation protein Kti12
MHLVLLSGLPTSGKSTFVKNLLSYREWNNVSVLSTDNYISSVAEHIGKTYDEVFNDEIKNATKQMNNELKYIIKNKLPIIWDQTNLTVKTRKAKLSGIPNSYQKIIVYFELSFEEILLRNQNRPGKVIPASTLDYMYSCYEIPTIQECKNVFDGNDPGTLSKLTTYLPYLENG